MNTLFLVSLIVEAIFGIGFVLAPGIVLQPMGVTLDEIATTFARMFGSAIISFPVLLWFARRSDDPGFRKGVVSSMAVYYLISAVLLFISQLRGQMNVMGWGVVVLHVVLTIWFGYYIVK